MSSVHLCQAGTSEKPLILGIKIEGTQRPTRLETQTGGLLDRERVARDLRRLWATGWFDDIRVEVCDETSTPSNSVQPSPFVPPLGWRREETASHAENHVFVVFKVEERPRYHLHRIRFRPSHRKYPVEIEPGAIIDKRLAHQVAVKLHEKLIDEGYLDAEIRTEVVPIDLRQADLHVRVQPGQRYRLRQVRFSGSLGLNEGELQQALRQTRGQVGMPGLDSLWKGLQAPSFSQRGVDGDLETLRSLYFSRGYWDAVVSLDRLGFDGNEATVFIAVESGPHFGVSHAEISGGAAKTETILPSGTDSATDSLCRCLRKAQRKAELTGKLDFSVQLEVRPPERSGLTEGSIRDESEQFSGKDLIASLKARVETGPSYKVGRIDFQGNHNFGDLTLRRALLLNEGELFDYGKLRGSLSRLNQMGFFETLTQDRVRIVRDPARGQVDLTLILKERPRGRWDLSGSADPLSLLKPVQFSIGSRLPSWGSRTLELSTYFVSLSLFPLGQTLTPSFLVQSGTHWKPLLAFGRPYLPGQDWRSGFVLLPQIGWKGTVYNTGLIQAQRVTSVFGNGSALPPTLAIPVWRVGADGDRDSTRSKFAGSLLCDTPKPHFTWVKSATLAALDFALTIPRF